MRLRTLFFFGGVLAGLASGAAAGEDSTDRWHGVGPAFYEVKGGLRRFAAGELTDPPRSQAGLEGSCAPGVERLMESSSSVMSAATSAKSGVER